MSDGKPCNETLQELLAHYDFIRRYLRRRIRSEHTAEDLAQEVFLRATEYYKTHDPPNNVSAWLTAVAHNTAVDYFRKTKREELWPELDFLSVEEQGDAELLARHTEELHLLRERIKGLPIETQELLRERYWIERSRKEIGSELGISANAVGVRLFRARQKIRRYE